MTSQNIQKLALTACFAVLLVTGAFGVSTLLPGVPQPTPIFTTSETDEELKPLESTEQNLADADSARASTEVLKPRLATLEKAVARPGTLASSPLPTLAVAQAPLHDPAPPAHLAAPSGLHPNHLADLRVKPALRMHWNALEGAAHYHVRAWQLRGTQKLMLTDKKIEGLEVHIEPPYSGPVVWQVAGVDGNGADGPFSPLLTVEIIAPKR